VSGKIKSIAARIRELREISNLSVEETAKMLNTTIDEYTAYEDGSTDIPIGFLNSFANKFNVDLTELLTGDSPRLRRYSLVKKGKGVNVERRAPYRYQSLAYNFINKKAEPFLVTVNPTGAAEVPKNSHPGQEFNYVLEGTLLIMIDNKEFVLNKGDSIYFDANLQHGMKALGDKTAEFLAIIF
jgi:quercetin dioxygenase-like cupin family protein